SAAVDGKQETGNRKQKRGPHLASPGEVKRAPPCSGVRRVADGKTPEPQAGFWTRRRSSLWIILPGLALLAWFALPHGFSDGGLRLAREGAARALLVQLSQAI